MNTPKVYWKRSHKAWYANIGPASAKGNRRPVKLVVGPDDKPTEKLAVEELWRRLAADGLPEGDSITLESDPLVSDLFVNFLAHHARSSKPGTHEFYRRPIEGFKAWLANDNAKLRVSTIKKHHVTRWLQTAYPKASQGYLHNIIRAIKAPFNWAHDEEYIERLPLRNVKPGPATVRDIDITPGQWEKIVAKVEDREFLDILWTLRLTGCRPQELRLVEKRHFDAQKEAWVFPVEESKCGNITGQKRTALLEGDALTITQERCLRYPEGPLFRNEDGNLWKKRPLAARFKRLAKLVGFPITAYALRHSFATDKIVEGKDLITIAALMGHRDLKMLQKHYQNVKNRPEHLRQASRKKDDQDAA